MELHPSEQRVRVGRDQLQEATMPLPQRSPAEPSASPQGNGLVLDRDGEQDRAFQV